MYVSKEAIGLAGEYAVAAELCRRGIYCQLTLGNHKSTDLLLDTDNRLSKVSVKTKQRYSWPNVRGIADENTLLVFVDFKGKGMTERPDFYVLNVDDWKKVAKKIKKGDPRARIKKEDNTVFWPSSPGKNDGWPASSVAVASVIEFKDKWPAPVYPRATGLK